MYNKEYGVQSPQEAIENLVLAFELAGIPAPSKIVFPKGALDIMSLQFATKENSNFPVNHPTTKLVAVTVHTGILVKLEEE